MDTTDRLGLPLLAAGQLQKELWVNESLGLLDVLVSGRLDATVATAPPSAPTSGVFYRVANGATGAWAGEDGKVAVMTTAGWRFAMPFEGMMLRDVADGATWTFAAGAWSKGLVDAVEYRVGGKKVVGARQPAIAVPAGGGTVDVEARNVVVAILDVLRNHGLIEA